jgi:hypothetical protein
MQQIAITQLTPQDLKQLVKDVIKEELAFLVASNNSVDQDRLNSREKTAKEILEVDLSTLHRWTQQGKIKAHAIGNRIYYKDSSIEEALVVILPKKKRL